MSNIQCESYRTATPVALFIFNRPETTEKVFHAISGARPPCMLVVADGPRRGVAGEPERCVVTRSIIDRVDWPCEVLINYADINMGCKRRVSSGLDWIFEHVEEAIILEDDCFPDPTFFRFCDELLKKYRKEERVAQISGDNFQRGRSRMTHSYYFSRYPHIWGWATWRRNWKHYDVDMRMWPEIRNNGKLLDLLHDDYAASYWADIFEKVYRKEINTWDYQLVFSCWAREAVTILPSVNLVSNIGFGAGATHTVGQSMFANMATAPLVFPMSHPSRIVSDVGADAYTEKVMFSGSSLRRRWKRKIRKLSSLVSRR